MHVEQSGSRKIWNPIVSTASGSPEPSASIADLPVESDVAVAMIAGMPVEPEVAERSIENIPVEHEVTVALELVQHAKENNTIDKNIYPDNFQESSSDSMKGMKAGEDGRGADDFGDFQESWGDNAVEPRHEISEDVVKLNGYSHADEFRTDLEAAKVRNVIFHTVFGLFENANSYCHSKVGGYGEVLHLRSDVIERILRNLGTSTI